MELSIIIGGTELNMNEQVFFVDLLKYIPCQISSQYDDYLNGQWIQTNEDKLAMSNVKGLTHTIFNDNRCEIPRKPIRVTVDFPLVIA